MIPKIGIDILEKQKFEDSLKNAGESFLKRIFTDQELRQNSQSQLMGIFCVKEAAIKALELAHDSWLTISTNRKENGKVECSLLSANGPKNIAGIDVSISHTDNLVMAAVVVLLEKES